MIHVSYLPLPKNLLQEFTDLVQYKYQWVYVPFNAICALYTARAALIIGRLLAYPAIKWKIEKIQLELNLMILDIKKITMDIESTKIEFGSVIEDVRILDTKSSNFEAQLNNIVMSKLINLVNYDLVQDFLRVHSHQRLVGTSIEDRRAYLISRFLKMLKDCRDCRINFLHKEQSNVAQDITRLIKQGAFLEHLL